MEIPISLLKVLSVAKSVAVLTGAGVSAESGIKTFRDPDGLWQKFNPAELASMDGFMANPDIVWAWYQYRRDVVSGVAPNSGHFAIAKMQEIFPRFTLITQNVDRLHQRAGSNNVLELHGNIVDNHCVDCQKPYTSSIALENNQLPKCEYCGGMIRPSVVWFGEMLPEDTLEAAYKAVNECDVFFSVGTSAEVYPAAYLPIQAKQHGAFTIEVNPNSTSISKYFDIVLQNASGIALPMLLDELNNYRMRNK